MGEDPDEAIASGDERLAVFYAFAAFLGISAELLQEALNDLAKVKDITSQEARELIEDLKATDDEGA